MSSARFDSLWRRGIVQEGLPFLPPTQPGLTAVRGARSRQAGRGQALMLQSLPQDHCYHSL